MPVPGLATAEYIEFGARFSADERVVYFGRLGLPDAGYDYDTAAFRATRTSAQGAFSAFGRLSAPAPALDGPPSVAADERTFFFSRTAPSSSGYFVFKGTFSAQGAGFLEATKLAGPVNDGASQADPYIVPDQSALYFTRTRESGEPSRIYRAPANAAGAFAEATLVSGLERDPAISDGSPVVTPDELTIYWARTAPPPASAHVYVATRADKSVRFSGTRPVTELNPADFTTAPSFVSADGCRLYFQKSRQVGNDIKSDIFVATKPR